MKKYEGDKNALCAYFRFTLGIPIPNVCKKSGKKMSFSLLDDKEKLLYFKIQR